MTEGGRLDKIEEDIRWLKDWMSFFIRTYYKFDSLSEVEAVQQQLRELPELKAPGWII